MNKAKGLAPKNRKLTTTKPKHTKKKQLTANQWQNTPQQHKFMDNWINPQNTETFGNAYKSAIAAGYSNHYALQLSAPTVNNSWITEYKRKLEFGPEHIKQGVQQLALKANNSRSPDDTRLKAYETLARIHGLLDSKQQNVTVNVVQPILGGASIKVPNKPIVDIDPGS